MGSNVFKAVIPAAGLGTRFLPATKSIPKEMLPIVDKPAIQYVVEEAIRAGLSDVLLITGRNKGALEDHFDRGRELEATLEKRGDLEKLAAVKEITELHKDRVAFIKKITETKTNLDFLNQKPHYHTDQQYSKLNRKKLRFFFSLCVVYVIFGTILFIVCLYQVGGVLM